MLVLEKIRYKNILSTGNTYTELSLNKWDSLLINGTNGVGKSTVIDAIFYNLFGKPYRNINLPTLVNSINQKNLMTVLTFTVDSKHYLVKRGMKPKVFEIYENTKLIKQDARIGDYQEYFEKHILKMNAKTFSQIVILGSSSYVPFMQLKAADRRSIVEDLLDIQIFSVMNVILKEKFQQNKTDLYDVDYKLDINKEKIKIQNEYIEKIKKDNENIHKENIEKIEKYKEENKQIISYAKGVNKQLKELQEKTADLDKLTKAANDMTYSLKQYRDKLKAIVKEKNFYHDTTDCPTCKQDITESFKCQVIDKAEQSIQEYNVEIDKLSTSITETNSKITTMQTYLKSINELNKKMSECNTQYSINAQFIEKLAEENSKLSENKKTIDFTEIKTLKDEAKTLNEIKEKLINERNLIEVSSILLKDNGIKAKIIKQYIPAINKLINKYLSAMDFFVQFEIDENFKETIKSRYRDEFSYENFSDGQKKRIDLALLFAFRSLAKMRNSASVNLLIFDEILDSSLDSVGTEELLNVLKEISTDSNVVVISHNTEVMLDRFDQVIRFNLVKNFSEYSFIKEEI